MKIGFFLACMAFALGCLCLAFLGSTNLQSVTVTVVGLLAALFGLAFGAVCLFCSPADSSEAVRKLLDILLAIVQRKRGFGKDG